MKTNYMICSALAFVLLCSYAVCSGASQQDEAVSIVLDILRSNDQERAALVAKARRSGFKNLPDVLAGPSLSLSSRRPKSGRIDDTEPFGSEGTDLIIIRVEDFKLKRG